MVNCYSSPRKFDSERDLPINSKAVFGIAFCAASAVLLSFLAQEDPVLKPIAPLLVLLVVIPTADFAGSRSAVVGATLASLIFAILLFPPSGRLAVHDPKDLLILMAFQMGSMAVSYLVSQTSSSRQL